MHYAMPPSFLCFGQCRVTSFRQYNKCFCISLCHPDSSFLTDHTQNTSQHFERFLTLHSLPMAGTTKQWVHFFIVWICSAFASLTADKPL